MTNATGRSWPTMTDFQEAIQAPKICFTDGELKKGKPVLNKLGLPRPVCGQFASVYEIKSRGARWAVKCFLRNIPDLHSRYAEIAGHLASCQLPYFVTFEYLQQGIAVRGDAYPVVKMEWVDGLPLNHFVEQGLSDRPALEQLERRWLQLLEDLRSVNVAHADLQHGNVLVAADGRLRLIDYDGMWVPRLQGQKSHETGHPDYQSPLRTESNFDAESDQFAGDVILVALQALARRPDLWAKYDNGDNLLFRRRDFLDPVNAELFADLRDLGDAQIDHTLDSLIQACGGGKARGPSRFFKPKRPWVAGNGPVMTATAKHAPPRPARTRSRRARATAVSQTKSVSTAAAASAASPGATLRQTRLALHLLLVPLVVVAAIMELRVLLAGPTTPVFLPLFGAAAFLGILSLRSLSAKGPRHLLGSCLFFGIPAALMLLCIFGELLMAGQVYWTGNDPRQCAQMLLMLIAGGVGLAFEYQCRREEGGAT